MKQPKFHVRTYEIEGLNIGKKPFVWNDKIIFRDAGTEYGNVAEARIFFDKPLPEFDDMSGEFQCAREGILILSIFLACFRLINKNIDLVIKQPDISGYSVYDIEDFKSEDNVTSYSTLDPDLPKHPEEYCKKYLTDTIPLFEKVMRKIDFKQKYQKNPLSISLPLFQRIKDDSFESIIDYVKVLESLVCENERELKSKLAHRTSVLVSKYRKKRKLTVEFLKEIYNLRSSLVHGSDISLEPFSEDDSDFGAVLELDSITRYALLEYIELVDSGLSKRDIIMKLDKTGLDTSNDQ